jgi:hypothetical protein
MAARVGVAGTAGRVVGLAVRPVARWSVRWSVRWSAQWAERSQQAARRNAMTACTELATRRLEHREAQEYVAALLAARSGTPPRAVVI